MLMLLELWLLRTCRHKHHAVLVLLRLPVGVRCSGSGVGGYISTVLSLHKHPPRDPANRVIQSSDSLLLRGC